MVPIIFLTTLVSVLRGQTVYEDRTFFHLTIANDGRIEALINADDPKWMTVYRNFLILNPDTRELVVAFNVAASEYPSVVALKSESHIMSSTIGSGETSWGSSENVTTNAEGYIHSNMMLWYDEYMKEIVMVYQSSSYWYYSQFDPDWNTNTDLDAYNQTLQKMRLTEWGWTEPVRILECLEDAHVHFQLMESLNVNDKGYAAEIMLPVHHLSESTAEENWQMIARTERSLTDDYEWDIRFMSSTEYGASGFLQASLVRVPGDNELGTMLIAFLRDANGEWVYRSTSSDDGFSWTDPSQLALPNPDTMSQAVYLHSGRLMLVYNPTQSMASEITADRYANAHHLAVGLSDDYGLTWQHSRMLEYAYDGMFDYPVALQDPGCNNIYLSYSVMTNEVNGCEMLDECTSESQNLMAYIKFTIITEMWVVNDFDYMYDYSELCTWQIPSDFATTTGFETWILETKGWSTVNLTILISLSIVLGISFSVNAVCYYFLCFEKKVKYIDMESQKNAEMKLYQTTNSN